MKIVILALGSRGDVQPYVALGAGLRAAAGVRHAGEDTGGDRVEGGPLAVCACEGQWRGAQVATRVRTGDGW